jgi:hypothetical protein
MHALPNDLFRPAPLGRAIAILGRFLSSPFILANTYV